MNGASLQASVAAQLQGVGETLTITRPTPSSTFSVVAIVSLATAAQIGELYGSAASRPTLVITLDGTQSAIKANDTFPHDGKTYSIQQPVTTLVGAYIITRQAACL
jgi:hypothetical protein